MAKNKNDKMNSSISIIKKIVLVSFCVAVLSVFQSPSVFASTLSIHDTQSTGEYGFDSDGTGAEFFTDTTGVPSELTVYLRSVSSSGDVYFTINQYDAPYTQVFQTSDSVSFTAGGSNTDAFDLAQILVLPFTSATSLPAGHYRIVPHANAAVTFYMWLDGSGSPWVAIEKLLGDGETSSGGADHCDSGVSRICTLTPLAGSVISSPDNIVEFTGSFYISPDDFSYYFGSVFSLDVSTTDINDSLFFQSFSTSTKSLISTEITSSGEYEFSTSTPMGNANYALDLHIQENLGDLFCFHAWGHCMSLRRTNSFAVNYETLLGHLNAGFSEGLASTLGLNDSYSSSTAILADSCSPFSGEFGVKPCLSYLFIPNGEEFRLASVAFQQYILRLFPLGYITRFLNILNDSTAVEPPALSYTFGRNSPDSLQGKEFSINIFDEEQATYLNTIYADNTTVPDTVNVWDIINPYLITIFAFSALFVIFKDLSLFNWEDFGLTPDSGPVEVFANEDLPVHDTALVKGQARAGLERSRRHEEAFNRAQRAEVLKIRK